MGSCGSCLADPDVQSVALDRPVGKTPFTESSVPQHPHLVRAMHSYLIRKQSKQVYSWNTDIEPLTEVPDAMSAAAKDTQSRLPDFEFNLGLPTGTPRGPTRLPNQAVYLGEWGEDGAVTGRGKMYGADGSLREGYWDHGELHGFGRIVYPNGDYYEGDFNFNKRHGRGAFYNVTLKSRFEGDWRDDLPHGRGEETHENAYYQGEYVRGSKDGRGKFHWPDGSVYEGSFKENMLDGQGDYLWFDGRKYSGTWKDNKMHGMGLFVWPDGRRYEGGFAEDKKEGEGKYTWSGKVYEGEWKGGKMHGKATLFNPVSGKKHLLVFDNGQLVRV